MAPPWIKITHWTPDKPEVFCVAQLLDIDPDAVVGKLVRVWIWADQQLENCHAVSVTKAHLDRVACVTGFADALCRVGWLIENEGQLTFTNFDRHNGETAKKRALAAKRKERSRNGHANSVTKVTPESRQQRDNLVTKAGPDEEEDEDIKETLLTRTREHGIASTLANGFIPPTWEELELFGLNAGYSVDLLQRFYDYNCANGWQTTRGPMVDWQAALRIWKRNDSEKPFQRQGRGNVNAHGIVEKSSYTPAAPMTDAEAGVPY